MEWHYNNDRVGARFILGIGPINNSINNPGQYLQFLWNTQKIPQNVSVGLRNIKLDIDQVLCTTYLNQVEFDLCYPGWVILRFNREFYCVHTNDAEVSCNGLLFFGSHELPLIQLDPNEASILTYLVRVLGDEFMVEDANQEEMLRILLKRFIIRCTRLAKKQMFNDNASTEEIDLIRSFHILVEEHYRTHKKVTDYANLMFRSPKTIANVFSNYSELTPLQVIHKRIAMEAERMFVYTDLSAKEIGHELGFEVPGQFSKFFKTVSGKSISQFRSMIIREDMPYN